METTSNAAVTLDELKDRFAVWRAGKTSRAESIPSELWDGAAYLALSSSVSSVAKALRLDSSMLKKKVRSLRQGAMQTDELAFTRTSLGSMLKPMAPLPGDPGWCLTIERPDGTTLKVRVPRADRSDLLKVATQFFG